MNESKSIVIKRKAVPEKFGGAFGRTNWRSLA